MKKISIAIMLIFSTLLISGCTKHYETVDEYIHSINLKMKHPSYIIDIKQINGDKEIYYRTYVIDDKWKTEKLSEDKSSVEKTYIYDGWDLLIHKANSKYAMLNMGVEEIDRNIPKRKLIINQTNPTYDITNWGNEYIKNKEINGFHPVFINQNDTRNGYKCRLIKVNENKESCVSDKYGIAVYQKTQKKDNKGKENTTITNVSNIIIKYIPDSTFKLSQEVEKKLPSDIIGGYTDN